MVCEGFKLKMPSMLSNLNTHVYDGFWLKCHLYCVNKLLICEDFLFEMVFFLNKQTIDCEGF